MTSLETGVQYGLSSQGHFNENKIVIFVKLTDSSHRKIEDLLRNHNKISQKPTIQFQGSEGRLTLPSSNSDHATSFTFSLSNDADIEGTQGGFECIQKTGPKEMESLGALFCKMRVHANEDIFETTRHRMQAVEVSNKNKCTRVLKSNETVGKKVKVKGTVRKILPSSAQNLSSTSPKQRVFNSFSSSSSALASAAAAATTATAAAPPAAQPPKRSPSNVNGNGNGNGNGSGSGSGNGNGNGRPATNPSSGGNRPTSHNEERTQKKSPEIMRRSLRERLIHLLALRNFKKPELYERIKHEGIKEQEKKLVATILKQISNVQSNAYVLHASMWNDVQEDWPFFTEEERVALKRRKPQNLTPPSASDTSGSGQSPNSLPSTDSPPRMIASSSAAMNAKRAGYEQSASSFPQQKRQRISDYRRPEVNFMTNFPEHSQANSPELVMALREAPPREQQQSPAQNPDPFLNFEARAERRVQVNENGAPAPIPDYVLKYTTIYNRDQKARYKADFLAGFEDYQKLHTQLVHLTDRYVELQEEWNNRDISNVEADAELQQRVVRAYQKDKSVKASFQYLHEKLSYIKQLVTEYDQKMAEENNDAY